MTVTMTIKAPPKADRKTPEGRVVYNAYMREYRRLHPGYERGINLRKKHGLTLEQYDAMSAAQGGVCAVCGSGPSRGRNGALHVDHDHTTGQIRALLCRLCNIALGHAGDSADRLRALAAYLDEHS